jgi:pimeloyl-ACP methyl ester carboxylesterase
MNTVPSRRAPRRAFAGLVACVSLLAGVGAGYAQPVKNIVLVHGAFADGSSWSRVIPLLQAKGYHVTAVQIPLTSFADDVAATQRAIARRTAP